MNRLVSVIAAGTVLSCAAIPASAQDDPFYEGKTLRLVVGYSPGGGSDLTCRVFANYLGKHVEGNPDVIVQNMPGASGANAINHVGESARKDGTTAICGTLSILLPLLDDPALRVDLRDFHFIAGVADSQVYYARSDVEPGLSEPSDIFDAEGLIYGGFRVSSAKDIPGRLALDLLGLDYQYVTGIGGDGAGRNAVQQNFVNSWMEGLASYVSVTRPTMVEEGSVVGVFQSGLPDEDGNLTQRDPAVPNVPTLFELYEAEYGKPPSGPNWEGIKLILGTYATSQRSIALPPGTPEEAVEALRAAVPALLADEEFRAEAEQVLGEGVNIFGGDRVQSTFVGALNASEEDKAFLRKTLEEGQALVGE